MIELDPIDRQILMILQRGIAIESRPYQAMADEIGGISEEDVIRRIARMKDEHIIRRMSGFFDSRRLGYQSVLVAVQPEPGHFDDAVRAINRYPGVTHNYERDHAYSIWFTLITINQPTLEHILDEIEAALDDVNVARYAQYLRRMTDRTQFIVITHRRGTMEAADVLYGVTMQEDGVSKILRLDLENVSADLIS